MPPEHLLALTDEVHKKHGLERIKGDGSTKEKHLWKVPPAAEEDTDGETGWPKGYELSNHFDDVEALGWKRARKDGWITTHWSHPNGCKMWSPLGFGEHEFSFP